MRKRLQVLLEESEWREIRRSARANRMTVAEWVRQALRAARARTRATNAAKKLEKIRAAARHQLPTANVDQMLGKIERGYFATLHR